MEFERLQMDRTRGNSAENLRVYISEIRERLTTDGYAVVRAELSEVDFFTICKEIGVPWRKTAIRIEAGSHLTALSHRGMFLHTDNPFANIMGWHCKEPCPWATPTCLVDMRSVVAKLPPEELKLLEQIISEIPTWPGSRFDPEPLISHHNGQLRLNYIPWAKRTFSSERHQEAFRRFGEMAAENFTKNPIAIALRRGESLFIDNNQMLHGRGDLPPESPRNLTRIWINTDGNEYVTEKGVSNFESPF